MPDSPSNVLSGSLRSGKRPSMINKNSENMIKRWTNLRQRDALMMVSSAVD